MSDEMRGAEDTPRVEAQAPDSSRQEAPRAEEPARGQIDAAQESIRPLTFGQDLKKEYKTPKKGNRLLTVALLGVAVVAVAVVVMLVQQWAPPPEVVIDTTVPVFELAREDIDYITVHLKGEEPYVVRAHEDGATTKYTVDGIGEDVELQSYKLGDPYGLATGLVAEALVEEDSQNLSQYGFDSPVSTLTIHLKDGGEQQLILGSKLPSGIGWYVKRGDGNTVYRISSYNGTRMTHTIRDLRNLNVMDTVTVDNADYILIERKDQDTLELRKDASDVSINIWKILKPQALEASSEAVYALAEEVAAVSISAYIDTPEDYAPYGLEEPAATCMVKDEEGNRIYYQVGDFLPEDSGLRYMRIVGTDEVYSISSDSVGFLKTATLAKVVDRFAALVNIANVDRIDFVYQGSEHVLTVTREEQFDDEGELMVLANGQPNYLETYVIDGERVNETIFKKIYQAMISVQMRGEIKGEINEDPVASITYTFNNGAEPATTEYIPYQQDFYAMDQNGTMLFYSTREIIDHLEMYMALARALPKTFEVDEVQSVQIVDAQGDVKLFERSGQSITYRGSEISRDEFSDAINRLAGSTLQEVAYAGVNADPVVTITYTYQDGRAPIVVEYRETTQGLYLVSVQGTQGYFTMNQRNLLSEIEYLDSLVD